MGREDSCTDSQTVNLNTTDYARVGDDRKPDLRATSDLFLANPVSYFYFFQDLVSYRNIDFDNN